MRLMRRRAAIALAIAQITLALVTLSAAAQSHAARAVGNSSTDALTHASESYGDVALGFEPNQGQANPDIKFMTRAKGLTALLGTEKVILITPASVNQSKQNNIVQMAFPGSRAQEPLAFQRQEAVSNYLLGSEPATWHTNIANFARVQYTGLYPGIDLVFYGNHRNLEHDFIVSPGADYCQITIQLEGAQRIAVDKDGSLLVTTAAGHLRFNAPLIYQLDRTGKVPVAGGYRVLSDNKVRFEVAPHDLSKVLVIDPVLSYSTYVDGSGLDSAAAIAVDKLGSAYITGFTQSTDFPSQNPEQATCNSCGQDVFVSKLNPTGTALVYSTYVGGSGSDQGNAIAIDGSGNTLVAGNTSSFDFPLKNAPTAILSAFSQHGFAFSLTPSGSALNFSTYLGGEGTDSATGIVSDALGNAYISGYTTSINFPLTPGNLIGSLPSFSPDIFLTKLGPDGSLVYSTVIGGPGVFPGLFQFSSGPISVAVDSQDEAILAGSAFAGFPTTPGSFQTTSPASNTLTAFIGKLDSAGTSLIAATYLGGSFGSQASAMTTDTAGNIYVTGTTGSTDFPTTTGAFQKTNFPNSGSSSFITKLNASLSAAIFSTYLRGTKPGFGAINARAISVDAKGRTYITGDTNNTFFPLVTPVSSIIPQNLFFNSNVAFLSVLKPAGAGLSFSTFFSGSSGAAGMGVASDASGGAYLFGTTSDSDVPTTPAAFQNTPPPVTFAFIGRTFVTKFATGTANAAACVSPSNLFFGALAPGQSSGPFTVTVRNCGTLPLIVGQVTTTNPAFTVVQNACATLAPGTNCAISVTYSPTAANGNDIAFLQINDNAPVTPQKISLFGFSALPNISFSNQLFLPDEVVNLTSFPAQVFIESFGAVSLHITSISVTGDFAAVNHCPGTLFSGSSCTIDVTFTPKAAGVRTGTLSIVDDAPGSPHIVSLTGNGLASYPKAAITGLSPGSAQVGSPALQAVIFGSGFFPTSIVSINGHTLTSSLLGDGELLATVPTTLLRSPGSLFITVVNPAPGGASKAFEFVVFRKVSLGVADAVFEPFTRKFYATVPAASITNPNTLVTIDPNTGTIGTPITIGNDPGALGLSSDGMTLYIGQNASNSILPFDIPSQTTGTPIPLGSDPALGPLSASSLLVQPNHPKSLIAALSVGFNGQDGLELVQNGKITSRFLNQPPNNVSIISPRFVSPTDLFGVGQSFFSGNGLLHFVITSQGLLEAPGIAANFGVGPFDSDGTNLYDSNGQVFNIKSGTLVGTFSTSNFRGGDVVTDTSSARSFVLDGFGDVQVIDNKTLSQVGQLSVFSGNGQVSRAQHWGTDGLSYLAFNFSTNSNDLVLFHTSLFNPAAGPNPLPTLTTIAPTAVPSRGPNFLLAVNGSHFIRGAVVQWNGSDRTTKWVSATKLIADIPASDIALAGIAKIKVVNPTPGGGASGITSLTIQ